MKRRIFAWIGIILIPVLYIISIILSVTGHPFAEGFLVLTLFLTMVIPLIIYTVTVLPKHLAEWNAKITDFHKKNKPS